MEVYQILLRHGISMSGRPQQWIFYSKEPSTVWETTDLEELREEITLILQTSPIPVINIVSPISFDISVDII